MITDNDLLDKIEGFLVGMAIGNSLGSIQEGLSKKKKEKLFGKITDYIVLKNNDRMYREPYTFTDDTQMALITIDSFLTLGRIDSADMAEHLLKEKENLRGIGKGTRIALKNLELRHYSQSGQSRPGNSPALRSSPLGIIYYNNPKMIKEDTKKISSITHTSSMSFAAANMVAHCVNYLLKNKDLSSLTNYLYLHTKNINKKFSRKIRKLQSYDSVENLGTSSWAYESVPTSLYIFLKNRNIKNGIIESINSGGDSDSIGALTTSFYGTYYGLMSIPDKWKKKLKEYDLLRKKARLLFKKIKENKN